MRINVRTREGYDLATGLRGPDIHPRNPIEEKFVHLLKAHTACRFRYLAGVDAMRYSNRHRISQHDREKLTELGEELEYRLKDYTHYIYHAAVTAKAAAKLLPPHKAEMNELYFLMNSFLDRITALDNPE